MKITLDSKLKFGDVVYIAELISVDELGEVIASNPVIREEKVKKIILNENGSIDYNEKNWFRTFEEAKNFCEKEMFNTQLSSMFNFDQIKFVWTEKAYVQEDEEEIGKKYLLEAELPEKDKDGNIFID